MTDRAANF